MREAEALRGEAGQLRVVSHIPQLPKRCHVSCTATGDLPPFTGQVKFGREHLSISNNIPQSMVWHRLKMSYLTEKKFNPSNAVATIVSSSKMQRLFGKHLNPVMMVFIGKLSLSTLI